MCCALGPSALFAQVHLTVSHDGTAQYSTVQAAVDAVPANNNQRYVIDIAAGTYVESIRVPTNKPFITFNGTSAANTILTYNLGANDPPNDPLVHASTGIQGKDFIASNISFENTKGQNGGQALAMYVKADRAIFEDCRFLGWQDTLRSETGRHYFHDCYIEGNVDFIYGKGQAYFDDCTIYSKVGGYVTAQGREAESESNGFVFHNSDIVGSAPNDSVYLGRPWQAYARVIYDQCNLGDQIAPAGWAQWSGNNNHLTCYFAEFNSTGPGASPSTRVSWSHQLTSSEVQAYSLTNWLSGTDGWNPVPEPTTGMLLLPSLVICCASRRVRALRV
jgi:pectin methylesterase-like acyl-CoA thioesterase